MNYSSLFAYWQLFKLLVQVDLLETRANYLGRVIDMLIYYGLSVVIAAYFMPYLGMNAQFGLFTAATLCCDAALYEGYPFIAKMIMDFGGDQRISYDLTLPIPTWMIFAKQWTALVISSLGVGCVLIPFTMLLIPRHIDFGQLSMVKLLLIMVVNTVFFGGFNLFVASLVRRTANIDMVWTRIFCPLSFLGGMQFSWQAVYSVSKPLSYLALLNPFVYVFEGSRAAVMGQSGSLPFWHCVGVLVVCSLLFGSWGIARLKKQRDCV